MISGYLCRRLSAHCFGPGSVLLFLSLNSIGDSADLLVQLSFELLVLGFRLCLLLSGVDI